MCWGCCGAGTKLLAAQRMGDRGALTYTEAPGLYWTDIGRHSIEVSDLDGKNRRVLFVDLDHPRAIVTHYDSGRLFWTDWGDNFPRIEVADLDGHERHVFVHKNINWPNGLSIDVEMKELYWTDAKLKYIQAIGLDGRNRRTVVAGNGLHHPYGVAVSKDWVYWTDWEAKALMRASKSGKSFSAQTLIPGLDGLMDLKVLPNPKIIDSACGKNNGNCSNLCLRNPKGFSCTCPTGIKLINGKKCSELPTKYLILASEGLVRRISLDTTPFWDVGLDIPGTMKPVAVDFHYKKQTLYFTDTKAIAIRAVPLGNSSLPETLSINSFSSPEGLCVDWIADNIYWTDAISKVLEVARLNGSSQKVIIRSDLIEPRALAIYPQKGYLFWTDWGNASKIERSSLDGSDRQIIFEGDVGWPNGITVDFTNDRIYWTDAHKRSIESANLDGTDRIVVEDNLDHPFGIAVLGSDLFWTDWEGKFVARKLLNSEDEKQLVVEGIKDPREIIAISANIQEGTNPCAKRNGGCTHLCLYKNSGEVVCACPDLFTQSCSEEPIIMSAKDKKSDGEQNGDGGTFTIVAMCGVVGVLIVGFITISVLFVRCRRNKESADGGKGSSNTLTYTNPTYAASHSDVNSERKPFAWKRIHHDNQQSRRFEEKGEVAALISEGSSIEHESPTPTPSQRSGCFEEVQV